MASSRRAFRSKAVLREWWGVSFRPRVIHGVALLMMCDLVVLLDYGHWHIAASLERPALQGLGLGLYLFAAAWQMWTDAWLARCFTRQGTGQALMSEGPFRHIRHPRYAGALGGKIAFALVFASLLGWLLALAWTFFLLRHVQAEETHLRQAFGAEYEAYMHAAHRATFAWDLLAAEVPWSHA